MYSNDFDFLTRQLEAAGHLDQTSGKVIVAVINTLRSQKINKADDPKLEDWIADALSLYRNQPIVVEDDREWADFQLGDVGIRATVRVKPNAYAHANAHEHNGKVGRVVGTEGRRISVMYDDAEPGTAAYLHEHTALQKLVK